MKSAIILHGMPSREEYYDPNVKSPSNSHWIPWIQRQLLLNDILAQMPELPLPFEPVYEKWLEVFQQFHVDENTILIGHSCGASFLVRWLSETNIKVGKVALVADQLKGIPNIEITKLINMGHLTFGDMGTEEFPELISWTTN